MTMAKQWWKNIVKVDSGSLIYIISFQLLKKNGGVWMGPKVAPLHSLFSGDGNVNHCCLEENIDG